MHYNNLRDFIKLLESRQELIRIQAPVRPFLEITEITDRVCKAPGGGKALLFENVVGSSFSLLTNAFGSEKRIALALGTENLEQLGCRLKELIEPDVPKTLKDKFRLLKRAFSLSRYLPRSVTMATPPCQEVILRNGQVDLSQLPVLHCWPQDGGPFITLPVVFTKSLSTGKRNVGMYRMQVYDRNTTGLHWHIHKDGAHFFKEYLDAGKRMEVAVAIGTDPAVTYAATAPAPRGIDEMLLAGFIREKPVAFVPAVTVDLDVPAEAEIILEGYVDPEERRQEGPFGDHTGYYSLPDLYPVFHVTALTRRRDAIYSTTVVGRPPMEDCYLALATERIFLPLLRTVFPEIRDIWMPWEGVFHNIAIVAIDKEYPGHARKIMYGLWGSGQMAFCKAIVVVDGNTPLKGGSDLKTILSTIDMKRDIFITEGILDILDHAAPAPYWGGKIGIDATAPFRGEQGRTEQSILHAIPSADELFQWVNNLSEGDVLGCRIIFSDTPLPLILMRIGKTPEKNGAYFRNLLLTNTILSRGIAIFYDRDIDIKDNSLILWKAFSNVDPVRDIVREGQVMIIDATRKLPSDGYFRPWPDDTVMNEEIKKLIDSKWGELVRG